ncbi:MAG: aldo/keto reductase, partial [Planctomycetota bacterium]
GDSRPNYPIFRGQAREQAHVVIDRLRTLAETLDTTVAKLAIGWALSQDGVTAALVGGRRPKQIEETAASKPLGEDVIRMINQIVASSQSA